MHPVKRQIVSVGRSRKSDTIHATSNILVCNVYNKSMPPIIQRTVPDIYKLQCIFPDNKMHAV
jgi:hypothetical protein